MSDFIWASLYAECYPRTTPPEDVQKHLFKKYVRADLYTAAIARAERAEGERDAARASVKAGWDQQRYWTARYEAAANRLDKIEAERDAHADALRTMNVDPDSVVRGMKENGDG